MKVTYRGHPIDQANQAWVRATGKRVRFDDHPWLLGPIGGPELVAEDWLASEAERLHGTSSEGGGLLASMGLLSSNEFDPSLLSEPISAFYEQTSHWRLEAWSEWSPVAWPFGWAISNLFGKRLQQLALPLHPLETARGMDSRVVAMHDGNGEQLGAAWLRTLRSSGQVVYSGWYGVGQVPNSASPSIRVTFPVPNGNVTVFLRPQNGPDGSLLLISPPGRFGDDGAYVIVVDRSRRYGWVRRVPLVERFTVWVDEEGVLRTDHALGMWRVPVLRFHYRLTDIQ